MTPEQFNLVMDLRKLMFKTGYQPIYAVSDETLTAVEEYITEDLIHKGLDPVLRCGKCGLRFKGCELVLEVKR